MRNSQDSGQPSCCCPLPGSLRTRAGCHLVPQKQPVETPCLTGLCMPSLVVGAQRSSRKITTRETPPYEVDRGCKRICEIGNFEKKDTLRKKTDFIICLACAPCTKCCSLLAAVHSNDSLVKVTVMSRFVCVLWLQRE